MPIAFIFLVGIPIFLFVEYIGNKIADMGENAVDHAMTRRKISKEQEKKENLADRYRS